MASANPIADSGLHREPMQLALALDHAESHAREDFLEGPSNAAALALIERWPDCPSRTVRLRALPVVALNAADDALLRAVIVKLFADRQLAVDESLVGFLTNRIERSFAAVREAVRLLDGEALRLKRPVTRALAGELFR